MKRLRIGTRGSELALRQTRLVIDLLREAHAELDFEEVILRTHGDIHAAQPMTESDWPVGGFVGTIERALLEEEIDIAVHSLKDLPTVPTPGLTVAAIPERASPHDVLVLDRPASLDALSPDWRVGTSSPRRIAQLRQRGLTYASPVRGNVPTRLSMVGRELNGVVLAAAGLERLGLAPEHAIDLPLEDFSCAPGQGALAVQCREPDAKLIGLLKAVDHAESRRAVEAERAVLRSLGAGCQTPLGAYARIEGDSVNLAAQLFSPDHETVVTERLRGRDSETVGRELATRLAAALAREEEA